MDEVDVEVGCLMDWDLEAVVRGCSSNEAAPNMEHHHHHHHPFLSFTHNINNNFFSSEQDDDMFFSFPEFSETTRVTDELQDLYKPFYPVFHTNPQPTIIPIKEEQPQEQEQEQEQEKEDDAKVKVKVLKPSLKVSSESKSKRSKKKQNKRTIKEVKAGEVGACDAWAWRKYGQKPIKGSPYPRSYYRCSTSKGCLARKQVERNHMDPGVFLITYTGDHSHPHPTRRNSLAGSTRKNNSILPIILSGAKSSDAKNSNSVSPSPRTPLVVQSMQDNSDETIVTMTSNDNNIIKGLKEEDDDFVDQDFGNDDWFPSPENIDDIMGLDYQQLEIQIDATHFMDHAIIL